MSKSTRSTWLTKLLGNVKAEEVIADTQQAAVDLDRAGVERKELEEEEQKPAETPPTEETPEEPEEEAKQEEGDMVSEVGAKLAQQIFDAAQGDLSKITQEQLATVIADSLRPAVEEEAPAETPPPPTEEQTMEDTNKEKKPIEQESSEGVKAMTDLLEGMVRDQGEMAKSYEALQTELAEVKSLKPTVEQLVTVVNQLKEKLNDRPRSASSAPETELDADSEQAKALESALKKSVNGQKTKLGIPVKDE